ncbi:MAG: hypothetical protein P8Q54_04335 [Akkermansiaceae bacterium]|nr:hypothetical protein [Akkermansiaceae bacterium]
MEASLLADGSVGGAVPWWGDQAGHGCQDRGPGKGAGHPRHVRRLRQRPQPGEDFQQARDRGGKLREVLLQCHEGQL